MLIGFHELVAHEVGGVLASPASRLPGPGGPRRNTDAPVADQRGLRLLDDNVWASTTARFRAPRTTRSRSAAPSPASSPTRRRSADDALCHRTVGTGLDVEPAPRGPS